MSERESLLEGGNLSKVIRNGDTVRRSLKDWSPSIHKLLKYLEEKGFKEASVFYGIDESNREILSFIEGETAVDFPRLKPYMMKEEVFIDVACILRRFHDLSRNFKWDINDKWMLSYPGTLPLEVICHNDCAPYNVVFSNEKVSGIIDFDTACPGPRIWDIAYTLYTFVPLGRFVYDPDLDVLMDYETRLHAEGRRKRVEKFLKAYGFNQTDELIDQIVFRLQTLCNTLINKSNDGDEAFKKMVDEGHVQHYDKDIEFIKLHGHEWV